MTKCWFLFFSKKLDIFSYLSRVYIVQTHQEHCNTFWTPRKQPFIWVPVEMSNFDPKIGKKMLKLFFRIESKKFLFVISRKENFLTGFEKKVWALFANFGVKIRHFSRNPYEWLLAWCPKCIAMFLMSSDDMNTNQIWENI